ncbi:MAG: cation:proton antiporter, partial [Proteobacteria bacterium]|nr:cation:proton antiporter [Pseudomonadota bacterium]
FHIGMEFDLKKMQQVLLPALLAVAVQTATFIFIGLQAAPIFGQGSLFGIFLGCLLAISSSMVTISILQDLKSMEKPHAQMAIAILIFEDILAITMLVVLSGIAVSNAISLTTITKVTFFILIFVVIVFFLGKLLASKAINFLADQKNEELITLTAVAFVLGISLLTVKFHFSEALGAFLAGSILAQSKLIKKIEHAVEPLRNVFTSIFFVSIGILIQPSLILQKWHIILGMSVLVVLIKIVSVWLGLVLGGVKPETGFRASVVKSQIGEFSFIIVALAINLKVADASFMTIAVGISILTSILSQLLATKVDRLLQWITPVVPGVLVNLHHYHHSMVEGLRLRLKRNEFLHLIRTPLLHILFHILFISGLIISSYLLVKMVDGYEPLQEYTVWISSGIWFIAAAGLLPFGSAIIKNIHGLVVVSTEAAFFNTGVYRKVEERFRTLLHHVISAAVIIATAGFYFSMAASYMPKGTALAAFIVVTIVSFLFFWGRIILLNKHIETFFLKSFERQLSQEEEERKKELTEIAEKYQWPVSVSEVEIDAMSSACGRKIRELNIRGLSGATIIGISRNDFMQYDPGAETMLFPQDHLFLFGDKEQTEKAASLLLQQRPEAESTSAEKTIEIERIYVNQESELNEKTLAGANLRQRYGLTVLGIQRGEQRITSPRSNFIINPGDILFVIGNVGSISELQKPTS